MHTLKLQDNKEISLCKTGNLQERNRISTSLPTTLRTPFLGKKKRPLVVNELNDGLTPIN